MKIPSIKPCPFCGFDSVQLDEVGNNAEMAVRCHNCGTTGPESSNDWGAAALWNLRPEPQE